jgi:tetratricopeptide (TPR) repeat protein
LCREVLLKHNYQIESDSNINDLCYLIGGSPLGLLLAAGYVAQNNEKISDYVARFRKRKRTSESDDQSTSSIDLNDVIRITMNISTPVDKMVLGLLGTLAHKTVDLVDFKKLLGVYIEKCVLDESFKKCFKLNILKHDGRRFGFTHRCLYDYAKTRFSPSIDSRILTDMVSIFKGYLGNQERISIEEPHINQLMTMKKPETFMFLYHMRDYFSENARERKKRHYSQLALETIEKTERNAEQINCWLEKDNHKEVKELYEYYVNGSLSSSSIPKPKERFQLDSSGSFSYWVGKFVDLMMDFNFLENIDSDVERHTFEDIDESELPLIERDFKTALSTLDLEDFRIPELYYQMAIYYKHKSQRYRSNDDMKRAYNFALKALDHYIERYPSTSKSMACAYNKIARNGVKYLNYLNAPRSSMFEPVLHMLNKALNCEIEFLGSKTHPLLFKQYLEIGNLCIRLKKFSEAIETFQKLAKLDLCASKLLDCHLQIVDCYDQLGQYDDAMRYCEKLSASYLMTFGDGNRYISAIHLKIVELKVKGDDISSLTFCEDLLKTLRNKLCLVEEDPLMIRAYEQRALIYHKFEQSYPKAISLLEKVVDLKNASLSISSIDIAETHLLIAYKHDNFSKFTKALTHYVKANEILRALNTTNDFPITYEEKLIRYEKEANICYRLAIIYGIRGDFERAKDCTKRSTNIHLFKLLLAPTSMIHLINVVDIESKLHQQFDELLREITHVMAKTLAFVSTLGEKHVSWSFLRETINSLFVDKQQEVTDCITYLKEIGIVSGGEKFCKVPHATVQQYLSVKKFRTHMEDSDGNNLMNFFIDQSDQENMDGIDRGLMEKLALKDMLCKDISKVFALIDKLETYYRAKNLNTQLVSLSKRHLAILDDDNFVIQSRQKRGVDVLFKLGYRLIENPYKYSDWGYDKSLIDEGFEYLIKGIERLKKVDPESESLITAYRDVANIMGDYDRYDDEIMMNKKALAIMKQKRGDEHDEVVEFSKYIERLDAEKQKKIDALLSDESEDL